MQKARYIRWFEQLSMADVGLVGGKNASLGQMIAALSSKGIPVPAGFAITAEAYWHYVDHNKLREQLKKECAQLTDYTKVQQLQRVSSTIQGLLAGGSMPDDLGAQIVQAYEQLSMRYSMQMADVAVRSSATAEDLPNASFAGQQESFLNVQGIEPLLDACKRCFASLFTARAMVYRFEHGFDHFQVALSIGVQKMVRSDQAAAGVAFSLDPESGFPDVMVINGSYGLGESVVKGEVTPDEWVVHTPMLRQKFDPVIARRLGSKQTKRIYSTSGNEQVAVLPADAAQWSLSHDEVVHLSRMVDTITQFYTAARGSWCPMDIEWAKDGVDGKIYIVQARPETVHAQRAQKLTHKVYTLSAEHGAPLVQGQSIGQQIAHGTVRIIADVSGIDRVQQGDIIVTSMTDPDWVPALKKAAGIITDRGGRTCHAAIVSRELGIPAIVGSGNGTTLLSDGMEVTLDCSSGSIGSVYAGKVPFERTELQVEAAQVPAAIMVNLADPDAAFTAAQLPVAGVGLARIEFVITQSIKAHPMALIHPERISDESVRGQIANLTAGYADGADFFVQCLSSGVATIAAAFYPRPVIVRLSDFKSNEYRNLVGGAFFEPVEENPMMGLRGASRYYHEQYQEAFALECAALDRVRRVHGLKNVKIMVPFVRTVAEAKKVIALMAEYGLVRGKDGLELIMMCEIPSNVLLIDQFAQLFDGFSIGSNDLAQFTLAVDRDERALALFDERDEAVKIMMSQAIAGAHRHKRHIGICGQAPSDYPDIAQFLIDQKIDSLSLNVDAVLPFFAHYR